MKASKTKTGPLRRLLGVVGRNKWPLAGVFFCAVLGNTGILIAPKLVGRAINLIMPQGGPTDWAALIRTLLLIAAVERDIEQGIGCADASANTPAAYAADDSAF